MSFCFRMFIARRYPLSAPTNLAYTGMMEQDAEREEPF